MFWEGILPGFFCGMMCRGKLRLWTGQKTSEQAPGQLWELKPWVGWLGALCKLKVNTILEECQVGWEFVTFLCSFGLHLKEKALISAVLP